MELGTEHVKECPLCQAKGYICELCRRANDVIFPFEINKAMEVSWNMRW